MDRNRLLACPLLIAALVLGAAIDVAAQERSFRQGSVWQITHVKTEPGQFNAYMENLRNGWMRTMEAAKAQGHVLSYRVISAPAGSPQDWDLMLMVEYPNMAALDNSVDVMDRVQREVMQQTPQQMSEAAVQRRQLREILGGKLGRELVFNP